MKDLLIGMGIMIAVTMAIGIGYTCQNDLMLVGIIEGTLYGFGVGTFVGYKIGKI